MKRVWIIISTLAIANLLAVVGLVMWLKSSDRLDGDRVQKIREMLAMTITEEKAKDAAKKVEDAGKAKTAEDTARRTGPSETAAEAIDAQRDKEEARQAQTIRLREEIRQLQGQLEKQRADLDAERQIVMDLKKRLEKKEAEINKAAGDEQFRQALEALEAQKPPAATQILRTMITEGKKDEAMDYLAAMDAGKRAKIIAEVVKSDEKLAAELLDTLRTRGIDVKGKPAATASTP